jgi:tungstate transport system ATP-binding protein
MNAVVRLQDASLHFGRGAAAVCALGGITLDIHAGERVALVGANGCGKSTLLRVMHGLLTPSSGTVVRDAAVRQAMLFQRPHLLRMPVLRNVALGLWLGGMPWAAARRKALEALERVGLGDLAQRSGRNLSGGEQQRVALARAWATSPQVLLLDEPTASLDPHAKREVEGLISECVSQPEPMTLIFASHNLGQVKRLAQRVIYLEQGRVLADLSVQDFFDRDLLQSQYPAAHLFLKGELA